MTALTIEQPLQILLGELRAGADVATAAVVANIEIAEALRHDIAEKRGDYRHIIAAEPAWNIEGSRLTIKPLDPRNRRDVRRPSTRSDA